MTESTPVTEQLQEQFNELKARLTPLRKKGMDTKIVELRIAGIPAKIRMAEVTQEPRDIAKVRALLERVLPEIEAMERETFKKQERENSDGSMRRFLQLIEQAHALIQRNSPGQARSLYQQIEQEYRNAPAEIRSAILPHCLELHQKLKNTDAAR